MSNGTLLPAKAVRDRFGGISPCTLMRWVARGHLPAPQSINGRNYWPAEAVERLAAPAAAATTKGGAK